MTRNLEPPRDPDRNVHIYDDGGRVLGGLEIREQSIYVSANMLYRYCDAIMRFSTGIPWAIFHLQRDGSTGRKLRRGHHMISSGSYAILKNDGTPIHTRLTRDTAPRRIHSRSPTSSQIARDRTEFQQHFRDGLREREERLCAISGRSFRVRGGNHLEAAHIFPVSRVEEWLSENYRARWITDTSPESQTSSTRLYSLQNGLLLGNPVHADWDDFSVAVDPDENFKIIHFSEDIIGVGGRELSRTATHSNNQNNCVSRDLLRWHLRMCLLRNMKGNAGEPEWEHDLGPDDIGEIMNQPDASERMEVELFNRLGGLVA